MSDEYKKLMDRLAVATTTVPKSREVLGIYRFFADGSAIRRHLKLPEVDRRPTISVDTEVFDYMFRRSLDETCVFKFYESPIQMIATANEEYISKVSKFGKRMRNKVLVPVKEKQIVNSNSHTKKRKKRK
jgi:hypothetical protein